MEVVPVLDVKQGVVVRGAGGRRDQYVPWASPLGGSSDPARALAALTRLWPFPAIYVADLDAIGGERSQLPEEWVSRPQPFELWIDSGIADAVTARSHLARARTCLVLGSESQAGAACVAALRSHARVLLSLDCRDGTFLGPEILWHEPTLWPARVIVMTLERVGADTGPDIARVAAVVARAGARKVYAAGGVRDAADLERLAAVGAAGALVASALHAGTIGAAELARYAAAPPG